MYCLTSAAGDRWNLTTDATTKSTDLFFERHIQAIERIADLVDDRLSDLLMPGEREFLGEACWRLDLAGTADFLAEEGMSALDEIAPPHHEVLARSYQLYAEASARTAEAIRQFLSGNGSVARIEVAFEVLQAHNAARDLYLESIDFPAWL